MPEHTEPLLNLEARLTPLIGKRQSVLRRIAKNFSIGFVGSSLLMALGVGRTVLLTKTLSVTDYGRVLVVINLFSFLSSFLNVRVNDVVYRFYPQFSNDGESSALKGLLLLSLALSLFIGVLIGGGVLVLAPSIAERFYQDLGYTTLFRVYAIAEFFLAFNGFSTSILRLHDKFASIVVPQVIGSVAGLLLLSGLFLGLSVTTLLLVIAVYTIEALLKTILPLLLALRLVWDQLTARTDEDVWAALEKHRSLLLSNLFQTSLVGYLKLGSETGGTFLLGVLAGPDEVALYGIASQMARVLHVIQNNIQTAVAPEIVSLWAEQRVQKLYRLVRNYTKGFLIAGGVIVGLAVALARPLILLIATPEYVEALPVFYATIGTVYLSFVSLVYFPLALSFDQLKRRNLIVSSRFIYLGLATVPGLDALSLAVAQLLGALTVRVFNDLPLFRQLRRLALTGEVATVKES